VNEAAMVLNLCAIWHKVMKDINRNNREQIDIDEVPVHIIYYFMHIGEISLTRILFPSNFDDMVP
jgi:hypothetical protein